MRQCSCSAIAPPRGLITPTLALIVAVVLFGLYLVLTQTSRIQRRLGVIGMNVLVRLTGLVLGSIAAQFVLDGVVGALSAGA